MLMLFGIAVWAGYPASAQSALIAALGATYLTTCVQLAVMSRRFRDDPPKSVRQYELPLWLKVSAPIMLMHGFFMLLQNVDVLVLNLYVAPSDIAIYYAAIKTTGLIAFVHFAVTAAFSPRFAEYFSAGRRHDLSAHLRESIKWSFWPSLLAAAGILAAGYPLLWLFGPEFTAGYPVMFILACGLVVRASLGPAEALLSVLGEQKICALVMSFTLAGNIAMNFALIPSFGLMGAATATASSIMLESVLLYWIIRRRLGLHAFVFGAAAVPKGEDG
jgi:O-antigen/teichoic acid export membrane protein